MSLATTTLFSSPIFIPLFLTLLPIGVNATETVNRLRRYIPNGNKAALSPSVITAILIGLTLFASCTLAFYLYKMYSPSNPNLPLYTMPGQRYRVRGGIRVRLADDYRARRPAQGAPPMASLPPLKGASTLEEGTRSVSIRSMPTAHTYKTKVAFPAAGVPAITATTLDTV